MSPAAESLKTAAQRPVKQGGRDLGEFNTRKGKKKKSRPKALIIFLIILALLAGSAAALYFSGLLNNVLAMVGLAEPTDGFTISELQAALDEKTGELEAREQEIIKLQEKLDAQQAALEAAASPSADPTFESILAGFSEEKLEELTQVGTIYSKMDPAAAAAIMTKIYDTYQIAVIIYHMQPAASALALAQMDPAISADVTTILTS